jgi:PDZ domain-containing protein
MVGVGLDRVRLPVIGLTCALLVALAGVPGAARAEVSPHRPPSAPSWPPGTDLIPFELRDGLILVRARLLSPSGRDTSGWLVVDTGAPELALGVSVWNMLNLDTLEVGLSYARLIRRTIAEIELGPGRLNDIEASSVIADSILNPGVLGLFAPSLYEDRAVVFDYENRRLAVVNQRLTVVAPDTAPSPRGSDLGKIARIRRSRSRYAGIIGAGAAPLPFRRFQGGRILVTALVIEPGYGWRSQPLTLLFDTGSSACAVFKEVMAERVRPPARWPLQTEVPFRTVLGVFREDATLLPRLSLTDATPPVEQDHVATGVMSRRSLPDIQGELPDPIHGLLGSSFLARYRIVLDYDNAILWLEPRRGPQGPATGRAPLGLHLRRLWGEMRAVGVEPGSPAAEAGIRPGDVVVSIDHAPLRDLGSEAAEKLLRGPPGTEVVITLRRDRMDRVYRLKRGSGP